MNSTGWYKVTNLAPSQNQEKSKTLSKSSSQPPSQTRSSKTSRTCWRRKVHGRVGMRQVVIFQAFVNIQTTIWLFWDRVWLVDYTSKRPTAVTNVWDQRVLAMFTTAYSNGFCRHGRDHSWECCQLALETFVKGFCWHNNCHMWKKKIEKLCRVRTLVLQQAWCHHNHSATMACNDDNNNSLWPS